MSQLLKPNKIMNELEQEIYNVAKDLIPKFTEVVEITEDAPPIIEVPFIALGLACQSLIWDNRVKRFTRIEYLVGVGNPDIWGAFEQWEKKSFDLPK